MIARQADRAGSDNEGSVCHGAVGDEENGGGSKRYLFWVLRRRDQDFQQEVGPYGEPGAGRQKRLSRLPSANLDVGINIFIQSAGRPETRSDILDAKRINQTTTHYGLPVVQTQASARKQV